MRKLQYSQYLFKTFFYDIKHLCATNRGYLSFNKVKNDEERWNRLKVKMKQLKENTDNEARQFRVFSLYHLNRFTLFNPYYAHLVYERLKPKSIIDPFAGYGGRLLGALESNCFYTGFDMNTDLKKGYDEIFKDFPQLCERCSIEFINSNTVDFTDYEYDMIFTSPPWGGREIYRNNNYESNEKIKQTVIDILVKAYHELKEGGLMVVNIPKGLMKRLNKCLSKEPDVINMGSGSYIFYIY